MATQMSSDAQAAMHPDDAELIEQLARLQHMHRQVNELRSLLPTNLLGAAREAIAHPSQSNPKQIAVSISNAAKKGGQDLQAFKKNWTDEKTRQLFNDANAANTPQGADAWLVDYKAMAIANKQSTEIQPRDQDVPFETVEEAKAAFEIFTKIPRKVKLQQSGDDLMFPLEAEVARMTFGIERDDIHNRYRVAAKTGGTLPARVAEQFEESMVVKRLHDLLLHLEAYHDIQTHKCDKCSSLTDSKLEYPMLRRLQSSMKPEDAAATWLALHNSCVPLRGANL